MNDDQDIFEMFLEKSGGAIEIFIYSATELMALSLFALDDPKIEAVCKSAGAVIKQIAAQEKGAIPRCLMCMHRFRPNNAGAPGVMVCLVPWASASCALSAGVCKKCTADKDTLEVRINKRISSMVPGSRFVMVEQDPNGRTQ